MDDGSDGRYFFARKEFGVKMCSIGKVYTYLGVRVNLLKKCSCFRVRELQWSLRETVT